MKRKLRQFWLSLVTPGLLLACQAPAADAPNLLPEVVSAESDDSLSSRAAYAADWWPLGPTDQWTLRSQREARTLRVLATGERMAKLSGLFAGQDARWIGTGAKRPNELYVWNAEQGEWALLIRFGRPVGAKWSVNLGSACERFDAKVTGTRDVVESVVASEQGYTVSFTHRPPANVRCAEPAFSSLTFVETVGPVGLSRASSDSRFVLASASVGGQELAPPASIYTDVSLEQLEANPQDYSGLLVRVVAEPELGPTACTKIACPKDNPCCNGCAAAFQIGRGIRLLGVDEETLGCSGNSCGMESCQSFAEHGNGKYALSGVFNTGDHGSTLTVGSFAAAECRKTGCSGEICANADRVSACFYQEHYACFADASCAPLADGHCGFGPEQTVAECLSQY